MSSKPYGTLLIKDVPRSRAGKHQHIVSKILSAIAGTKAGTAIKVPLASLGSSKANVRSALNRAMRKRGLHISTATDDKYLYVWNGKEIKESA